MDDTKIIRICLIGAIASLFSLYFLSFTIEETEVIPSDIDRDLVGRRVILSGTVKEVSFHPNGHIFFEIKDNKSHADIVIWEDRAEQFSISGINLENIKPGTEMEVKGTVELYKGGLQVVI